MSGILVVEDEDDIRQDVEEVLRDEGYDVVGAPNGAVALAHLRTGAKPRLILLDLMMPVMDGVQFRSEQLGDRALADIPVVFMSGASNVRQKAEDLKASGVLVKPFRLDDLLRIVAREAKR